MMKKNFWLSVVTTVGVSLRLAVAQEPAAPAPATPAAPETPPAVEQTPTETQKPVKTEPATKAPRPKPTLPEKPGPPLTVGPAMAKQNNINVRATPALKGEVLNRLKKGERVEVLEIVEQKPKPNEPDKWARVALPTNTALWVHSDFVDSASSTVKPNRLNVRSGPTENHMIVVRLDKGTALKEVERKENWIRIEPPQGAYGFVAAHLLAAPPVAPPVEVVKTDATPPPAAGTPAIETTKVSPPGPTLPATDVAATTPATTPAADPTPAPESAAGEEIKRVVSREGIVKRSVSIQAPTWFVLESADTGKTINYLYTPSPGIVLRDFFGQRVIVTGEEGLDERWPNTPVINVESIEVVP
jgi:uncharacterized protein YgiM (DUF1202 family)